MQIGHVETAALDDRTARLSLSDGPPVEAIRVVLGQNVRQPRPLGTIHVHYGEPHEGQTEVNKVSIELVEPITPAQLRQFPWTKVLAAADASMRAQQVNTLEAWREAARQTAEVAGLTAPRPKGRPSLPATHYVEIAERYLSLTAQGVSEPNVVIAEERNVNRNTVAGWVRKARQRGLLPPARKGKAG